MKKLFIFFNLFYFIFTNGQTITNYSITANTTESLVEDLTGWTTLIGSNQSGVVSPITNIGFEVWFMGQRFTQFSVNANGVLRFGATQIVAGANTSAIAGNYRVCAFSNTSAPTAGSQTLSTEVDGFVRYKLIGAAPNRELVVDWFNMRFKGDETSTELGRSRFQVHIKETSQGVTTGGVIKIIYGKMRILEYDAATCMDTRTGIGAGTGANQFLLLNTDNHPNLVIGTDVSIGGNLTNCNFLSAAPSDAWLNSTANPNRKYYKFMPPIPIGNENNLTAQCSNSTSIQLNWIDSCVNETGMAIYRSLDGINYTFLTQLPSNSNSFLDTGLLQGTTYYYQVLANTEGNLSAIVPGAVGNTVVSATKPITPTYTLTNPTCSNPNGLVTVTSVTTGSTFSINGVNYNPYTTPIVVPAATTISLTSKNIFGCVSNVASIIVPAAPVSIVAPSVTSPITLCSSNTMLPLTATPTAGGTLNWYGTNSTGGVASTIATIPSNSISGPTLYYVSQTIGACEGPRAAISVTITPQPSAGFSNTLPVAGPLLSTQISLFSSLAGSPTAGGTWVRNSGTGGTFNALTGTYLPGTTGTTSTFTYSVGDLPCNIVTSTVTLSIAVPPFTINNPSPYIVCDDNAVFDGVAGFDLHIKDSEVTTNPLLEVHYFYTLADANANTNEILTNPFFNNNPSASGTAIQTVYIRVHYITDHDVYVLNSLDLQVNPRPLQNLVLKPLEVCDFNAPHNGVEPFNLHDKDLEIANGQTGVTVNYYDTQANAILNDGVTGLLSSPYTIPTSTPIATTQTIYYNISFNSNGCGTVGPLDLIVNSLPVVPLFYTPFQQCELETDLPNPNDGIMLFNFENYAFPTTGPNGLRIHLYPSTNDALNDTNEINALGYYNTIPYAQTLGVRLTNVITGCYSLSTLDLIVNPLPNPFQLPVSMTSVCDDGLLGVGCFDLNSYTTNIINGAANVVVTYHITEDDAKLDQNPITINPYCTSVPVMQHIYVRETNTLTGCYKVITLDLTVTPKPLLPISAPNLITDLYFCDEDLSPANNQDGTTTVDLTTQTALLLNVQTQPASNYTVTYYTSIANATHTPNGLSPIVYPATYLASNGDTIWVRIQDNITGCFNYTSFKIIINTPLALPSALVLQLCDDELATTPPTLREFDLVALANPLILGSAIAANFNVAYYLSQADANLGINAVTLPFTNTTNPQDLYVVVTSGLTCRSFTKLTLEVLPLPTPKFDPADLQAKCDDDLNNNNLGFEFFNLTQNAVYITNGLTNVTLSYHYTHADADLDTNPIPNPALALVSGDVFIRVESNLPGHCYVIVTQKLKVLPLPKVSQLNATTYPNNTYQICQYPDLSNPAEFNLTSLIPELLITNPTGSTTYTTTFYTTYLDAQGGTNAIPNPSTYIYSILNTPKTIYVRVVNDQTGCVNFKGNFKIVVNPKPKVNLPASPLNTCDTDGINDGLFSYPLDILVTDILGPTQTTGYSVSFYDTLADAHLGSNPIINKTTYMGYTHSLWIRVENNITHCYELGEQKQIVEKLPDPTITTTGNVHSICVNYTTNYIDRSLTLNANYTLPDQGPTPNTYQWYEGDVTPVAILGATSSTYVVPAAPIGANNDLPRVYRVEVKSTSPSPRGCSAMSPPFEVIQSGQAEILTGTNGFYITNAFTENQIVTVTVQGYGTYQYSLDGGTPQDSPVFENVTLGEHFITVIDVKDPLNTCLPYTITPVQTIDYPHFFTPNGDNINDYWNINGLGGQLDAKIYIFDRQGKLIKQVAPNNDKGWDGTYNNMLMPATDYWFTVDFTEQAIQKQFKAHFSLKR